MTPNVTSVGGEGGVLETIPLASVTFKMPESKEFVIYSLFTGRGHNDKLKYWKYYT